MRYFIHAVVTKSVQVGPDTWQMETAVLDLDGDLRIGELLTKLLDRYPKEDPPKNVVMSFYEAL